MEIIGGWIINILFILFFIYMVIANIIHFIYWIKHKKIKYHRSKECKYIQYCDTWAEVSQKDIEDICKFIEQYKNRLS